MYGQLSTIKGRLLRGIGWYLITDISGRPFGLRLLYPWIWDPYIFPKRRQPTTYPYRITCQRAATTPRRRYEILCNKGEISTFLSTCHPLNNNSRRSSWIFSYHLLLQFLWPPVNKSFPTKIQYFFISPLTAVTSPARHILQHFHHYKEKFSSLCNILIVLQDRLRSSSADVQPGPDIS